MNEEYYQIFPEKSSWFNFKIMKLRRQPKYYNDLLLQLDILVKMGKNCIISQDINKEYFPIRQDSYRKMYVFFVWYGQTSANWLANRGINVLNKNIFIVR